LKERVRFLFLSNAGVLTVAGNYRRVLRKWQKLGVDGADERGAVAAGKVGSAD
jgi:hypothetical protein